MISPTISPRRIDKVNRDAWFILLRVRNRMKDRRGGNEENQAHSRVLIVLNFIATHVSDKKKNRRKKKFVTFIAWSLIIRVWSSLTLLINLAREFRGVVQLLEKIRSAYAETEFGGQLGRVLSNSTELPTAKCERFFGHNRTRYFLMYLSAISAPRTSSEFDELDVRKGGGGGEPLVGEKTVAPTTLCMC